MEPFIIEVSNLSKQFRGTGFYSVDHLSLQIRRNEIYGILGPNGAGKTTLISMMCGYLKPTGGKIKINGLNLSSNLKKIQQIIGVVPQEYALYGTLTARENLIYFGAMYGLKGKELFDKINYALERLGLDKFADKKIETFSGGMKRRVNLIAGILHQPELLFLDEPTVGVDVQSRTAIIDYLKELNGQGMSIIYTSHHLTEAEDLCSSIAIVDHGKILVEGRPSELTATTGLSGGLEGIFVELTGKGLRDHV